MEGVVVDELFDRYLENHDIALPLPSLYFRLSAAGIIVSVLWGISSISFYQGVLDATLHERILAYILPWAFVAGWIISLGIHLRNIYQ